MNTDKSTAVIFRKWWQWVQKQTEQFEEEIPLSGEAEYSCVHFEIRLTWKAQNKVMGNKATQHFVSLYCIFKSRAHSLPHSWS
jgi:hypothetical protein